MRTTALPLITSSGKVSSPFTAVRLSEICQKINPDLPIPLKRLVRIAGLEPARITPLPPQSSASANSAICAGTENNEAVSGGLRKRKLGVLGEVGTNNNACR